MMSWRAILGQHGEPRYLLLGAAGADTTTLVEAASRSTESGVTRGAAPESARVVWNDVGGVVIINVPGSVAFPPTEQHPNEWQRLLRQLRRLRPRRPIDGIILALPASLIFDPSREDERVHLAVAIRERFALAQGILGFTLPVYVVITKADEIVGFDTFTGTLTEDQRRNMLGWSSPHDLDRPFSRDWVDQGIDSLHDAVVRAEVERFVASTHLDASADLFLFSGALRRLAGPLRELLDEVFRPSLYHEAFYCRGFYLCGRLPGGSPSVAFLDDLLASKVFAERGLGRPLEDVVQVRKRSGRVAQIVCALLIVGLGLEVYWGYSSLRRVEAQLVALLTRSDEILFERRQAAASDRPLPVSYRLDQSRRLLAEQVRPLNDERFSWVAYRLNPSLRETLTRIFRDIVLEDFRVALEDKGQRWLHAAQAAADDPAPSGPDFQDRARYKMLARFAQEYPLFVQNYRRYEQLRRVDGAGTFASLSALSEYLDGTRLTMQTLGRPYARALRNANAAPFNCAIFEDTSGESLVAANASALLDEFRAWSFDDRNPVRSAALDFMNDWTQVTSGSGTPQDLDRLIDSTTTLSAAVTAWTTLGTAATVQQIALFDEAPFTSRLVESPLCRGLVWPDLGDNLREVEQLKDTLRSQLVAMEVEPFGPILTDRDPGLVLSDSVAALKKDLDTLQSQSFWSPLSEATDDSLALRALSQQATWRTEDIDAALRTANALDDYRGTAFNSVDGPSRETLLDLVEAEVSELVATRLHRTATEASDLPSDSAAMLDGLKVTASVTARLGRLAPLLSRSSSGQIVLSTLDHQAQASIAAIDLQASRNYPWMFAWPRRANTLDGLFNRWQDLRRNTAPADARKLWEALADSQRDAAPRFAALATPFATYLVARRNLSESALRWARIGHDVASYEQKLPDNGLGALDALIRNGVPAMIPASNCVAGASAIGYASGEYFGRLRDELAREGERQCRVQVQRDYALLVSVFNARLRGKFPFVDTGASSFTDRLREVQGRPEATPEEVRSLLDTYRSVDGPVLTSFLDSSRSCISDPALAFLRGVDNAATLLAPAVDPQLKAPTIVLDLKPEFRVRPNPGTGGDQIAEWRMDVGSRSVREPIAATAEPLPWRFGDPVSIVARFARDSPSVPAPGAGLPLNRSGGEDRTVRFDFTGNWAIFRLLLARTISNAADALLLRDEGSTVLGVDIPVQPDVTKPPLIEPSTPSQFEVYMKLSILPRGKTEVLKLGALPTQAPTSISCLVM